MARRRRSGEEEDGEPALDRSWSPLLPSLSQSFPTSCTQDTQESKNADVGFPPFSSVPGTESAWEGIFPISRSTSSFRPRSVCTR